MPPSHHSSSSHTSSHSSSSRSSFSGSSSRSSSSSSRSSFSSGPSRHSGSSYSSGTSHSYSSSRSTSGSGGRSTASSSRTTTGASRPMPASVQRPTARKRTNQPSGYYNTSQKREKMVVRPAYHHDYWFYPVSWTNENGRTFEAGYYDEDGKHYNSVAIENEETTFICEYCGSQTKVVWKSGAAPTCENCGAPLKPDIEDKKQENTSNFGSFRNSYSDTTAAPVKKRFSAWRISILVLTVLAALRGCIGILESDSGSTPVTTTTTDTVVSAPADEDGIFVESIGRYCPFDGENYYDEETECWFWYNEDQDVWQYWYEGISSDFGDYGWMEWSYDEDRWYIEVDDGEWVPVDELGYDTSHTWHFE